MAGFTPELMSKIIFALVVDLILALVLVILWLKAPWKKWIKIVISIPIIYILVTSLVPLLLGAFVGQLNPQSFKNRATQAKEISACIDRCDKMDNNDDKKVCLTECQNKRDQYKAQYGK